jgi:hypothetical protein
MQQLAMCVPERILPDHAINADTMHMPYETCVLNRNCISTAVQPLLMIS